MDACSCKGKCRLPIKQTTHDVNQILQTSKAMSHHRGHSHTVWDKPIMGRHEVQIGWNIEHNYNIKMNNKHGLSSQKTDTPQVAQ